MIPAARKPGNLVTFKVTLQELRRRVTAHFFFPFFYSLSESDLDSAPNVDLLCVSQGVKTGPAPRARTETELYGGSTPLQAGNCRMKYVMKVLSQSRLTARTAQFCWSKTAAAVAAAASLQTVSAWMLQFDRN